MNRCLFILLASFMVSVPICGLNHAERPEYGIEEAGGFLLSVRNDFEQGFLLRHIHPDIIPRVGPGEYLMGAETLVLHMYDFVGHARIGISAQVKRQKGEGPEHQLFSGFHFLWPTPEFTGGGWRRSEIWLPTPIWFTSLLGNTYQNSGVDVLLNSEEERIPFLEHQDMFALLADHHFCFVVCHSEYAIFL